MPIAQVVRALGATFTIAFKKFGNAANRFAQVVFVGQEDDAEVVRLLPVETGALHQHDAGFAQQFQEELARGILLTVISLMLRQAEIWHDS